MNPPPIAGSPPSPAAAKDPSPFPLRVKGLLDTVLVADVFLVIGGAIWFAAAVILHTRQVEAPLEWFQRLWEPLFTPAIGLLMAASVLSGILGWWQRRGRR